MGNKKVMVSIHGQTEIFMKENGLMVNVMAKETSKLLTMSSMKEIGKLVKLMAMVYSDTTIISTLESSETI